MAEYKYTLKKFLKDWALIIGMVVGASAYLIYAEIPALHPAGPFWSLLSSISSRC